MSIDVTVYIMSSIGIVKFIESGLYASKSPCMCGVEIIELDVMCAPCDVVSLVNWKRLFECLQNNIASSAVIYSILSACGSPPPPLVGAPPVPNVLSHISARSIFHMLFCGITCYWCPFDGAVLDSPPPSSEITFPMLWRITLSVIS